MTIFLIGFSGVGQTFYNAAKSVESLGYFFTDSQYRHATKASFKPIPANNWINVRMSMQMNDRDSLASLVDVSGLKSIEVFYLKTRTKIRGDFYGRAEIQEWIFSDEANAANAAGTIENAKNILGVRLEKAPWAYWRKNNKLYFVISAGQYMDGEYQKIVALLKEKTNG